jgi:hypothetical protein
MTRPALWPGRTVEPEWHLDDYLSGTQLDDVLEGFDAWPEEYEAARPAPVLPALVGAERERAAHEMAINPLGEDPIYDRIAESRRRWAEQKEARKAEMTRAEQARAWAKPPPPVAPKVAAPPQEPRLLHGGSARVGCDHAGCSVAFRFVVDARDIADDQRMRRIAIYECTVRGWSVNGDETMCPAHHREHHADHTNRSCQ